MRMNSWRATALPLIIFFKHQTNDKNESTFESRCF